MTPKTTPAPGWASLYQRVQAQPSVQPAKPHKYYQNSVWPKLFEAMRTHPGLHSAELAQLIGVCKETVRKQLLKRGQGSHSLARGYARIWYAADNGSVYFTTKKRSELKHEPD